jgi:hypothetical protein
MAILIYGAPDLEKKFRHSGIKCRQLALPIFPRSPHYSALFALSNNDILNLKILTMAKTSDPDVMLIARCNHASMMEVFKSIGVDRILTAAEPIDPLIDELQGVYI